MKIDFLNNFFNSDFNSVDFTREFNSVLSSEDLTARVIPFLCVSNPTERLNQITKNIFTFSLNKSFNSIWIYECEYINPKDKEIKSKEKFILYKVSEYDNIFLIISLGSSYFYNNILKPVLKKLYPHFLYTFITNNKLKKIIDSFQTKYSYSEIRVLRETHQIRIHGKDKSEKNIRGINWGKNILLEDAFKWIYENNGWFKSLFFEAINSNKTIHYKIGITRQGVLLFDRSFNKIYESFILPICKILNDNYKFFDNRARRNINYEVKPLQINLSDGVFSDKSMNSNFISALKSYKKASVSVIHGNPYIHITTSDFYDGSVFDIWVLDEKTITIVPQLKASVPSIKRLINHIFDNFEEGEISEYKMGVG